MAMDRTDMLLGDALVQMCDGIHGPGKIMQVDDTGVHYHPISYAKDRMKQELTILTRDAFIEAIEEKNASFSDIEKAYGLYDSFAMTTDGKEYFAWYNNGR